MQLLSLSVEKFLYRVIHPSLVTQIVVLRIIPNKIKIRKKDSKQKCNDDGDYQRDRSLVLLPDVLLYTMIGSISIFKETHRRKQKNTILVNWKLQQPLEWSEKKEIYEGHRSALTLRFRNLSLMLEITFMLVVIELSAFETDMTVTTKQIF